MDQTGDENRYLGSKNTLVEPELEAQGISVGVWTGLRCPLVGPEAMGRDKVNERGLEEWREGGRLQEVLRHVKARRLGKILGQLPAGHGGLMVPRRI